MQSARWPRGSEDAAAQRSLHPRLEHLTAGWRRGGHLRHLLVDPLIDQRFPLRGLVRGQAASRDVLVNALVGRVLQRGGDVGGVFAVRLRNLRQRFAWQLLSQLSDGNANRRGRRVEVPPKPTPAWSTRTKARTAVPRPKPATGGQSRICTRLPNRGLQCG